MVLAALFVALGVVLAKLAHAFIGPGARMLLPMHIPVLLCGFICGAKYGLLCGILTPLISSLVSGGMPAGDTLIAMVFELAAYGFFAGLLSAPSFRPISRFFPKKSQEYVHILLALIFSMLIGRGVWGIIKAVIATGRQNVFGWTAFLAGAFTTAIAGIVIQIIIIPPIVLLLNKAKLSKTI